MNFPKKEKLQNNKSPEVEGDIDKLLNNVKLSSIVSNLKEQLKIYQHSISVETSESNGKMRTLQITAKIFIQ